MIISLYIAECHHNCIVITMASRRVHMIRYERARVGLLRALEDFQVEGLPTNLAELTRIRARRAPLPSPASWLHCAYILVLGWL